jgi:hypothetical protein
MFSRGADEERERAPRLDPKIALEVLGASAGVAALMALLGGALLWLRFDELGLPADRAVTLLPRELLITVGAHALVAPLVAALVAVGLIWLLDDGRGFVAIVVAGIGVVVMLSQVDELLVFPWGFVTFAAVVLGLALIFATARRRPGSGGKAPSRKPVLWVVFAVFLAAGTVVALVRTGGEPKMEPIAVLLKDPDDQLAGFYIGESSDELHIAQLRQGSGLLGVSANPVEAIVSVARDRVVRKALRRPAGLGLADDGREQVETLLEDLVAEQRALNHERPPTPPKVATTEPWRTFAPLVSLHAGEPSPPMDVRVFLRNATLHWAFRGCPEKSRGFGGPLTSEQRWRDLGAGGYKQAARCGDGDVYTSADYTRPFGNRRTFGSRRAALEGREGFYLDLDDARRKAKLQSDREGEQRVLRPVPVYYERHPDRGGTRITYWFFYPFSFPTGTNTKVGHEGDWERISVLVRPVRPGLWQPVSVRYHQHDGSVDVPWADVRKAPDESGAATHPRAYSAKGSHATYRRGGRFLQVLEQGRFKILSVRDDARACPACPLWFTWRRLVDAETQPWYGFGGAWGRVGSMSDFTGPLGPSTEKTVGGRAPSPEASLQQGSDAVATATAARAAAQP